MARAIYVKKARKPNPVITQADIDRACAGEEGAAGYWKWSFRFGGTHYSKNRPRPSQLTQSEFKSAVYELQEQMEDWICTIQEDLRSARDEWAERAREIGDEQREKLDNMPDGLRDGDTGQLLEERADAMDAWADELECVDLDSEDYSAPVDGETEDKDRQEEIDWLEERLEELRDISPDI